MERTLGWDGCVNARDLGGLPLAGGGHTRFGAVVRADNVRRLTDAGWGALADYGVVRIVDLRFHEELALDPPRDVAMEVVHVPVLPEPDDPWWPEVEAIGDRAADPVSGTRDVYLAFLERRAPGFALAVEAVADAPDGAVLIHCLVGKDRTGLVSALLLSLAGVANETIAADYALSEANLVSVSDPWVESAPDEAERARRRRIVATPAVAMVGVLRALDERNGGVRGYLLDAGASERALERVAARLT
jgi:hypothetical protein